MFCRTYVDVVALFSQEGIITPKSLTLHGQIYEIDRVLCRRPAAAMKAGGSGMRYTVRIHGHETFLFLDTENRWFVEEKQNVRQIQNHG